MCRHRCEYRSAYGWVSFCSLQAYGVDQEGADTGRAGDGAGPSRAPEDECSRCPDYPPHEAAPG
ncbi:MAG: hypothetical protein ACYC9Q_10500 [Bacillota bacterium]